MSALSPQAQDWTLRKAYGNVLRAVEVYDIAHPDWLGSPGPAEQGFRLCQLMQTLFRHLPHEINDGYPTVAG